MSIDLFLQGMMVFMATPTAVELLHWMGVLGCGKLINMGFWQRGTISLAHIKRPASSASAAEEMIKLMIYEIVRTGSLMLGTGIFKDNMMFSPDWLRSLLTLR